MTPEQRFSAKARKQAAQGYEIDSDKSLKALANELKPKRRGLLGRHSALLAEIAVCVGVLAALCAAFGFAHWLEVRFDG